MAGLIALAVGGTWTLTALTAGVSALAGLGYWRNRATDPGLTSELALVLTVLLGALCLQSPALAAGAGVVVAVLLAARTQLHRFVRGVMTEGEVTDGLTIASATLVVLPMLPDRPLGPYGAFNPHALWMVMVLVMAIGAGGRAVVRLFGGKLGLPVFAFASGFVSSLATIAAMSDRARHSPSQLRGAAGGAILSTVATILQLAIILAITSRPTLAALAIPLVCAGVVATGYGAAFTLAGMRGTAGETETMGAAFSLRSTLVLGGMLAGISFSVAVLKGFFGEAGAVVATAIAGIADTHAPAVSIATLVASGRLAPAGGVAPILAGLTTNTLSKVAAAVGGGRAFALCVVPGLVVIALAAWAGALFGPMLHIAWSGKP